MKTPRYTDLRYLNGYRRSVETDVRATFRRVERERAAQAEHDAAEAAAQAAIDAANAAEAEAKVVQVTRKRAAK